MANTASLTLPQFTLLAIGNEVLPNGAALVAPMGYATGYGSGSAKLAMPKGKATATGTFTVSGNAKLAMPSGAVQATATFTVSGSAKLGMASLGGPTYRLVGYSGAVVAVSLTGRPTVTATGTAEGMGRASLTLPLFELTASGGPESVGRASLLMPAPVLKTSQTQAWLVAPMGRLTAIGSATVAVEYEAYAVNLESTRENGGNEVTRYTSFPFNQIVRLGAAYYGVADDGLYLLAGPTDNGAPIEWGFDTGLTDFDTSTQKTPVSGTVAGRIGPSVEFAVHTGEKRDSTYRYRNPRGDTAQNYRQKFGRGLQARYYSFGLNGSDPVSIDTMEIEVQNLKRSI